MTALARRLGALTSPPPSPKDTPPLSNVSRDSDFNVILAGLLCALICALGLIAVARCSWIRRGGGPMSGAATASANKGLKKKVLKSLPKQTVGEDELGDRAERLSDCAICLAEFAAGEEIRVLPQCGHAFHVACIDTWLGSHSSCPSCRAILVVAPCKKCDCGSLPAATALGGDHVDSFLPGSFII